MDRKLPTRPKRQTRPAPTVLMANDSVVVQWCWRACVVEEGGAVEFENRTPSGYGGSRSPTAEDE